VSAPATGPGPLGIRGHAFQICYVAADRATATDLLGRSLGLGDWIEFEAEIEIDPEHGAEGATVAVAFARWGRIVVEVLQPLGGSTDIFSRELASGAGLRIHHVGVRVADLSAARRQSEDAGAPCVLSGGLAEQLRYAFVDARPLLGHHLELVEFAPSGWELMAGILGSGADDQHQ
jgi:hypothetical protein